MRLALARLTDRLAGVTVRIDARNARARGDARYVCRIAMTPAPLEIREEHDRLDTAIDRAVDRAARLATSLGRRSPLPPAGRRDQHEGGATRTIWRDSHRPSSRHR